MKFKNLVAVTFLIISSFGCADTLGAFPKVAALQLAELSNKLNELKQTDPEKFKQFKIGLNVHLKDLYDVLNLEMDPFGNACPDRRKIKEPLSKLLVFLKTNSKGVDFSFLLTGYLSKFDTESQMACNANDSFDIGGFSQEISDFSNLQEAVVQIQAMMNR